MSKSNWITILALFFWWEETKFFGWNAGPSCIAELFADGLVIAFLIVAEVVGEIESNHISITAEFKEAE